ncbi:putative Starvation lipoprotein Slp paralog [Vibrio nigripulchritudo SOn1]|uniref:Starvation lipoprotein Slp paralog n=1 Tax=Vibrio nigripulchritudo SOn1 TaxID=1238450 RepID=A0AAV2VX98_9VIBR|nr:Slp family lipoprotein [Vibrio nigripulchritudo]CCO49378.1 putative Starvation lipoprotein Slp paralog [Vibrio nigripulchritudo SOn1]
MSVRRSLLILSTLLISACSSLPEQLTAQSENVITDYPTFASSSEQNVDVRLGGLIASVTNLEKQSRIEVVNLPISKTGKPDISTDANGRFVAYVEGFVDPVTFAEGRVVTVVGKSQPTEKGKVGEFEYTFPVMNAYGVHLWKVEESVIIHDFDTYLYPCYGIHCRSSRLGSSKAKVIQEVK